MLWRHIILSVIYPVLIPAAYEVHVGRKESDMLDLLLVVSLRHAQHTDALASAVQHVNHSQTF